MTLVRPCSYCTDPKPEVILNKDDNTGKWLVFEQDGFTKHVHNNKRTYFNQQQQPQQQYQQFTSATTPSPVATTTATADTKSKEDFWAERDRKYDERYMVYQKWQGEVLNLLAVMVGLLDNIKSELMLANTKTLHEGEVATTAEAVTPEDDVEIVQ